MRGQDQDLIFSHGRACVYAFQIEHVGTGLLAYCPAIALNWDAQYVYV